VLLFWSLDRLSREGVLETLTHLQRLTGCGVAWRSFTEQYLDSTGIIVATENNSVYAFDAENVDQNAL